MAGGQRRAEPDVVGARRQLDRRELRDRAGHQLGDNPQPVQPVHGRRTCATLVSTSLTGSIVGSPPCACASIASRGASLAAMLRGIGRSEARHHAEVGAEQLVHRRRSASRRPAAASVRRPGSRRRVRRRGRAASRPPSRSSRLAARACRRRPPGTRTAPRRRRRGAARRGAPSSSGDARSGGLRVGHGRAEVGDQVVGVGLRARRTAF